MEHGFFPLTFIGTQFPKTMEKIFFWFLFSFFIFLTTFNRKAGASLEFVLDNDDNDDRTLTMKPSTANSAATSVGPMDTVPKLDDSAAYGSSKDYDNKDDNDDTIKNDQTEEGIRSLSDAERTSAPAILSSKLELILEMQKDLFESNRLYLILVCSVIGVGSLLLSLAIIYLALKISKLSSEKADIVSAEEGKYLRK
ncbi:hypothetical protein XENTR_v10013619 [Xenopus tropicalis]|nr:hypothetical protein XENTR_v10013619 [Xenopus tropicalis]